MSAKFRLDVRPFGITRKEGSQEGRKGKTEKTDRQTERKAERKTEKKKDRKTDAHELTSRLKFVAYVQKIQATFAFMYCRQ